MFLSFSCGLLFSADSGTRQHSGVERLASTWGVQVSGDADEKTVRTIEQALQQMPRVDACSVLICNDLRWNDFISVGVLSTNTLAKYIPPCCSPGERIIVPKNVLESTITHEWAHKREYLADEGFLTRWDKTNKYAYGCDVRNSDQGNVWSDYSKDVRYGFITPYARKNRGEDIAELTEFIRHQGSIIKRVQVDKESAEILLKKTLLLEEGYFIHARESYEMQGWLKCSMQKNK